MTGRHVTQADRTIYLPEAEFAQYDDGVPALGAQLDAINVSAWFGTTKVLHRVNLAMPPGIVTALIGPSGCGKSTFLRILNRMHERVASAQLSGEVRLNGEDIYAPQTRVTDTRRRIGMVFQKPNPFPTMSISDNVVAGLKLNGTKVSRSEREQLIEQSLMRAGLWLEVKDRLGLCWWRTVWWSTAAFMYRALARGEPGSTADGRAVFGSRPDVDAAYRADDSRPPRGGHHRDRHA